MAVIVRACDRAFPHTHRCSPHQKMVLDLPQTTFPISPWGCACENDIIKFNRVETRDVCVCVCESPVAFKAFVIWNVLFFLMCLCYRFA